MKKLTGIAILPERFWKGLSGFAWSNNHIMQFFSHVPVDGSRFFGLPGIYRQITLFL